MSKDEVIELLKFWNWELSRLALFIFWFHIIGFLVSLATGNKSLEYYESLSTSVWLAAFFILKMLEAQDAREENK